MSVISTIQEADTGGTLAEHTQGKCMRPYMKKKLRKKIGSVAQVKEHLPSKLQGPEINP
jgi:hypothetical protein